MRFVLDIEANGFYDEADTIWCAVFRDIDNDVVLPFIAPDGVDLYEMFDMTDLLIGHNIIDYDLPLIEKLFGVKYSGEVFDTYTASCLLNPDRKNGHSLKAWGNTLGFPKGEHHDFDEYSPDMLKYCMRDTEITKKVYEVLSHEMGLE